MEAEPVQFLWRRYEERLDPARAAVARFIGARPRDLVFVTNATSGVNAVIRSMKLRRGDEILTTNQDYNACHNVLVEAARVSGARLVTANVPFPLRSEAEVLEAVLAAVSDRTRVAMIDHVTSDTGLVFPVERIVRELETRGVDVLIDGAHAPGMVRLDMARLRPAYYTANLHKWVCAPKGAAFLWVREDKQDTVQPAVISHGNNRARAGYSAFQDRFDWAGTLDPTPWFCAGEAIRFIGELVPGGWREVRRRNHTLAVEARRMLCQRLEVQAPSPEGMLGSLASIPLPEQWQNRQPDGRIDAEQIRLHDEFGIEVPFMRTREPKRRYLRISAHLYNTMAEYEYLAYAVRALLAG
jgi:isopenicillin-N epimerase